ncbi:MAG: HAD-IA family hydrolase [Phycisphaeraceae bacterium]|nr:HAD-IA family hydrolase [Phycisphaeraceae bacterium]
MMTPAVIFDMDGVLIDSYEAHFQSWIDLARETGKKFNREDFTWAFGRTSRETVVKYWGSDLSPERVAQLDDRKEELYRVIIADKLPVMPGVMALMDDLHRNGFMMAVGSSGPPENVYVTVDQLGRSRFDAIVTGKDVKKGKPNPEVFLTAAKKLGLEPNHCAVIEDAPAGIAAAKAAGMVAIGLTSTGRTRTELVAADVIVGTLTELNADKIRGLIESRC